MKKMCKEPLISEDDERRALEEVQKLPDAALERLTELAKKPEEELLGR